jgi:hypothetical protein
MPPPPERGKAQEVRQLFHHHPGWAGPRSQRPDWYRAAPSSGAHRAATAGTSCLAASRHTARGPYPPPKAPCAYYDRIRAANDGQWIDFEPIVQSVYERLLVPGDTAGDLTTAVGSFRTSSHARFAG